MSIEFSAAFMSELSEMVVTCKEFKETILKIFEVLLSPKIEARSKPKLLFFDGGSFDKMCEKLEKLMDEFNKETTKFLSKTRKKSDITLADVNDTAIDMNHRKKLIKILKDYKGKNSPHKLKVVQAFLRRLERDISTYGDFKKAYFEDLKSLYGKKEIYSSTKESTAELNLWEEISGVVSKWPDGAPLDEDKHKEINAIYGKYARSISKEKKDFLNVMINTLRGNAERYSKRASKISRGNDVYKQVADLVENMNKLRAKQSNSEEEVKQTFEDMWNSGIAKALSDGWVELKRNDLQSGVRSLSKMIGTYSAHYKKGSKAIDDLYEYLRKGFDICFISKDFYDKLTPADFPELGGTNFNISVSLEAQKRQIIRSNLKKYDISHIQAFTEQLKREKF